MHKKQRATASRAGISSCDPNCTFWCSTFVILRRLVTSLDTEVSVLPRRRWMRSEIQITLDTTVIQWWIALMFPPPLNPLKGGIGSYLIRTFIRLLNCFISYCSEKSQMRSVLALPTPNAHLQPIPATVPSFGPSKALSSKNIILGVEGEIC